MRHAILAILVCGTAIGCTNMKGPQPGPSAAHQQMQAEQAQQNQQAMQRPAAAAMGRTGTSLRDVRPGDRIAVLQYVDKTETWVTGQVESLDEERLTMVQCAVEERNYDKKGAPGHSLASRYSLPPDQVRAIRVP